MDCRACWDQGPIGEQRAGQAVTLGNSAGVLVVSVLVVLSQASDGRPPAPRVEPPKPSVPAPPTKPPASREGGARPGGLAPGGLATKEEKVETAPPTEAAPRPGTAAPNEPAPPQPATPSAVATLDLDSLEKRLRETRAIGVFTKLSLKNQVDDLLNEFRDFHKSRDRSMLPKLRQAYDLLLLKVLSLLQDSDPVLARDVSSSREALWSILTDPDQFRDL